MMRPLLGGFVGEVLLNGLTGRGGLNGLAGGYRDEQQEKVECGRHGKGKLLCKCGTNQLFSMLS
jgi:hypothetical protein